MYTHLSEIHKRPEPFSVYTADTLWTEPHLSKQMLEYHLNQETDLASRRKPAINDIVNWIDLKFGLKDMNVCDLGCGPGLYTRQFALRGAHVTGLDFSANSIAYAKTSSRDDSHNITYRVADYLKDKLPSDQDLITMIYCDLCVLSPLQREYILGQVHHALNPSGVFLFDVMSIKAFDELDETSAFGRNYMGGFWAEGDYFTFHNRFKYEAEKVVLDQFTIIEPHRSWQVFNWMLYYDSEAVMAELSQSGFDVLEIAYDFGKADGASFGVIASPRRS